MAATLANAQEDPYQWLEDVTGEKQLAWVEEHNARSRPLLENTAGYKALHQRFLEIYNSKDRIPAVTKQGAFYYNFWQDAANPRGLLRRTTLAQYRMKDPAWETVIDFDKLGADEKENWVYKGMQCLYPKYQRCLVTISRGGADASEVREFDLSSKQWVKDGFHLAESKGEVDWRTLDSVYIARDFGPGSMTTSGYPRIVKEWKRGTPMADAKVVIEGRETDVGMGVMVIDESGRQYEIVRRAITYWDGEDFLRTGDKWVKLDVPGDGKVTAFNGMLVVQLRSAWKPAATQYTAGTLISVDLDRFLSGNRDFEVVYAPRGRVSLQGYTVTKNYLLLDILDNVNGRVIEAKREASGWKLRDVPVPSASTISVSAVDRDEGDAYWITTTNFIEPTTLSLGNAGSDTREKLKSLPALFDAKGLTVSQYEATSRDGTNIPYFVVMREGTKLDGNNPTVLYGYGGFEIPMKPSYSGVIGAGWLEWGGVWVLANIRGGGEFGPEWHNSAIRENRHRTHDDFQAVGDDIVKRGITSPRHLAAMGGSQGGLLVGTALTQRPDLFKAIVCQVPLLDMKRYSHLLAGASWMGEYGDPDVPGDWEFISKYSPYQNVFKDRKYPKVLFYTSTRDDRVHPGHARKMVAKMEAQGHEVLYFENTEGGHAGAATPAQQAYMWARTYSFLRSELR